MNTYEHAHYARQLIDGLGGLEKAAAFTTRTIGKQRLSDYQNPNEPSVMPADVIADLERALGKRIYSRALFEAGPHEAADDVRSEIDDVVEATGELFRIGREATADNTITRLEDERIRRAAMQIKTQVDDVIAALPKTKEGESA